MKNFFQKIMYITKQSKSAFIITFSLGFMLFLYAPLEILFNNMDSFWFDMYMLIPPMAIVFAFTVLTGCIIIIITHLLNRKAYIILTACLFIAYICTYIQGNYLVKNLPRLDGTLIEWDKYTTDRLACIILWTVCITITCILLQKIGFQKFQKFVTYICVFITLILFVTLTVICINTKGYQKKPTLCTSDKNLFTYSEDTNFIIFVVDSMDARDVHSLLSSDSITGKEYRNIFDDFTFYYNMMGGYPFTGYSVPLLLSGEWYENSIPSQEYFNHAYLDSPLFQELEDRSYQINVYYDGLQPKDEKYFCFSNVLPSERTSVFHPTFAILNIKLVGLKYLPFDFKKYCTLDNGDFDAAIFLQFRHPAESASEFTPYNTVFYDNTLHRELTTVSDKQFKYIHIEGAHNPFQYNKNVEYIQNGTYQDNLEACMTIINAYLQKLKDADVYDNSVIIIMADHGFDSSADHDITNSYFYRQNPVFFVKGIDEHHSLSESSAPVSFVDLQDAYVKLMTGNVGSDIFDYKEGDSRERRWLYYDGGEQMTEYIQTGDAWNASTLRATENKYPAY